jgi:hypothetical protein
MAEKSVKTSIFLTNFSLLNILNMKGSKKTGIEIRAKNRQAAKTDQAFVKGEALLKQGDLAQAGLYFSHVIK